MPKVLQNKVDKIRKKIGGKWRPTILFILHAKPERFNKLKQLMAGVSPNELSKNLKDMEDGGLVLKDGDPPKYRLTDHASRITELLHQIQIITEALPIIAICI